MNRIISAVKDKAGRAVANKNVNIICYANDAVLIANNENDLQRLLHQFHITVKQYYMEQ